MDVAQFIVILRKRLGDPVRTVETDQFWTDDEFLEYINECCYEFARKTRYFTDSTSAICSVDVTAGDEWVDLSDRIFYINRAKLDGGSSYLRVVDSRQLDMTGYRWEETTGRPQAISYNEEPNRARFDRTPIEADTLRLHVVKLPDALVTPASTIAVPEQYVHKLIPGVRSYAYGKQDCDAFDANKSLDFAGQFQAELTKITRELKKMRRRTSTVRYNSP